MNAGGQLTDGWINLIGGVDSSRSPDLIGDGYCSFAGNVTFRGGKPRTRPRLRQHAIDLSPFSESPDANVVFENGLLQGAGVHFDQPGGSATIMAAISGGIYNIEPGPYGTGASTIREFAFYNHPTKRTYFLQAENFTIIQNGHDIPLIWDGNVLRRALTGSNNPELEVVSITQTSGVATLTTVDPHPFQPGDYIQINNAYPDGYNGEVYVIDVPSPTTLTYSVDSSLASPASVVNGFTMSVRYTPEIPVGTIMAYGQGRIFVASPDRTEFIACDIIYGDPKGTVGNILRATETTYLAEGGAFRLPAFMGRITSMAFVPYQDTATGQGDLIVFGERGAASYNVSLPRKEWSSSPIQRVLFSNIGCTSHESVTGFNGDLLFRSFDGLRSYRMARADAFSYGQTPISAELNRILEKDFTPELDRVSSTDFDNRFLITALPERAPYRVGINSIVNHDGILSVVTDRPHNLREGVEFTIVDSAYADGTYTVSGIMSPYAFEFEPSTIPPDQGTPGGYLSYSPVGDSFAYQCVLPLDFTSTSANAGKTESAYDGAWVFPDKPRLLLTGMFDGLLRSFIIGKTEEGNSLWELETEYGDDIGQNEVLPIQSWLETRSFDFTVPFEKKRLARADLWISELEGSAAFRVFFRPDQYPGWVKWHEFVVSDPGTGTHTDDPLASGASNSKPEYRTQIKLPEPPDEWEFLADVGESRLLRQAHEFQIRIEWTGNVKLEKLLIYADPVVEQVHGGCLEPGV